MSLIIIKHHVHTKVMIGTNSSVTLVWLACHMRPAYMVHIKKVRRLAMSSHPLVVTVLIASLMVNSNVPDTFNCLYCVSLMPSHDSSHLHSTNLVVN